MATIESLGAALFRRVAQQDANGQPISLPARAPRTQSAPDVAVVKEGAAQSPGEVRLPSKPSIGERNPASGRDSGSRPVELRKQMTLDELAEVLRKVNLTFDLFEIQTRFTVDSDTGEITVQVVNQRTGEVIRKIPPYDLSEIAKALEKSRQGGGDQAVGPLITDIKA